MKHPCSLLEVIEQSSLDAFYMRCDHSDFFVFCFLFVFVFVFVFHVGYQATNQVSKVRDYSPPRISMLKGLVID